VTRLIWIPVPPAGPAPPARAQPIPPFALSLSKPGGQTTYRSTIDAAKSCVWHFNQTAAQDVSACAGANWAQGSAWPDWLMFGDPHNNSYEGTVYYDDVKMEEWSGPATP